MNEEPPVFEALLRGVSFRPVEAKAIVKDLEDGAALLLEREPTNAHDDNAIKVCHPEGEFLGYVAKEVAADLAPWMDKDWHFTCNVNGRMSASIVILDIRPILPTSEEAKDEVSDKAGA